MASYDGGATFALLWDEAGLPISAVGSQGPQGEQGIQGEQGEQGTPGTDGAAGQAGVNGAEGLSLRVAVNAEGYYVIQSYYASDSTTTVEEIVTPYTAQPELVFTSIEQNDRAHTVTFTLADGQNFTFPLSRVLPTGIVLLRTEPLSITSGGMAEIEFRVNPSTAVFNYDVTASDAEIQLDVVSSTRASYVTAPTAYRLSAVHPVYNDKGEDMTGQYRATIQDLKQALSYDDRLTLVLTCTDATGQECLISSDLFELSMHQFDTLRNGLPIVAINTPDLQPITSKEVWTSDVTMTIYNPDGTVDYDGTLSMKGRGNTTWGHPKNPYSLKLDKKSKVLGMPTHKRWVLLANWMDRTLIRDAVAFEIARRTDGLAWTPDGRFVELVLNGQYAGNYYLCEQIKVDKNRVNITELDTKATSGDALTGGYIFELDINYDEAYKFYSSRRNLPWMFKDPDEVNEAQYNYAVDYVNRMEEALYDSANFAARAFEEYMDLNSFVDYWFVYELTCNWEPNHPKSVYMHKDVRGKMTAGPVWDFDCGTFADYSSTNSYTVNTALYYDQLFQDETFRGLVKQHWQTEKLRFESVVSFIDSLQTLLEASNEMNYSNYPIGQPINGDEDLSYSDAIAHLKRNYLKKLNWLDYVIQQY
jgi:hypothetical protein